MKRYHPLETEIMDFFEPEDEVEESPAQVEEVRFPVSEIEKEIRKLWIYNKAAEKVRLELNAAQENVWYNYFLPCLLAGQALYFIILKARQEGISTLIQAFFYVIITKYSGQRAYIIAQDKDAAEEDIFSRTRTFWEESDEQRPCVGGGPVRRGIWYAKPWRSRIKVDTCDKMSLGRGGTNHWLHLSEPAHWPLANPRIPLLGLKNTVPKPEMNPFTGVIWESTAKGANHFKTEWKKAENGKSYLKPIFLDWQSFPEYFLMPTENEILIKSEEIQEYQDKFELSEGQMKFMLEEMNRTCDDDIQMWHQEYPATAALAFQDVGRFWFDRKAVNDMQERAKLNPPIWQGLIEPDPRFPNDIVTMRTEGPSLALRVWEKYIPGVRYVASLDPGHGLRKDFHLGQIWRLPDPLERKYDPPCNCYRQVAEYRSCKIDPELAVIHMYLVCMEYGYPLWGIEWTGMGRTAVGVAWNGMGQYPKIRRYPRLYRRIKDAQMLTEVTEQFGWDTNKATKRQILQSLRGIVRQSVVEIFSLDTLNEMEEFQHDDTQSDPWIAGYEDPETEECHDDGIMSSAIAYRMAMSEYAERSQEQIEVVPI